MLTEGEVVTIIRQVSSLVTHSNKRAVFQDLGDGWWEGIAANGASGLFPETYVEVRRDRKQINEIDRNRREIQLGGCYSEFGELRPS